MSFPPSHAALEEARQLFRKEGLPFPPIPSEMQSEIQRLGNWLYGTRSDEPFLYAIDQFVDEAIMGSAPEYVLFGHSGRGTNSWAQHFYLVRGPLCLFVQVGWGGAYFGQEGNARASALMARIFVDASDLIKAVEQAQQQQKLEPGDCIVVVISDLYGAQWAWLKAEERQTRAAPDWIKSEVDTLLPAVRAAVEERTATIPTPTSSSPLGQMNQALERFLRADELDELPPLKDELDQAGPLDPSNTELLWIILQEWDEKQAIANLLMYPDVMPHEARFSYMTQALRDTDSPYLALAAIVGLEKVPRGTFTKQQRKEIVDLVFARMESSIHSENPVIAERATIALVQLLEPGELLRFQRWLNYPNEIIRHNVIVGFIDLLDLRQARELIESVINLGATTPPVKAWLQTKLAEVDNLLDAEAGDITRLVISELTSPILPYIPNYKEWRNEWNDAP